jgi:hypothetical protein
VEPLCRSAYSISGALFAPDVPPREGNRRNFRKSGLI